MSEDASTEQKAIFEQFKNIIRNIQQNSQSGIILPSAVDPDTRAELFSLDLLSTGGGQKSFDTDKIKDYYRTLIFIGLSADILLMGNTSTGSFALGNIKNSLTSSTVEQYLNRIVQVINDDLVRQIYELNGWNPARRCVVDVEDFQDVDLEVFSTAIQRMGATGYLPKNLPVVNAILASLGIDPLDEDANLDELLPDNQSKVSEGMATPSGGLNGTGKSLSKKDNSVSNLAN